MTAHHNVAFVRTIIQFPSASLLVVPAVVCAAEIQQGEMAGYLFGPAENVPEEFNAGFSLYAAAWPIVATYPGHSFQTGLCGTWMHPQYEAGKEPAGKCYTDIEGGLGWWRDTHFPTITPKFIMGGVGPNFKFADQPAMLNADLTPEEREVVQRRVEMLHRAWTKDRNYLAPPDVGTLASLDPALILTPPRGMKAGYVPIATRQELAGAASHPNDQEKARQ
jgi:hypothetical protein